MENPAEGSVRRFVNVLRDNKVLLVHRTRDGADDWGFPRGTPHPGESTAGFAARETQEEAGLPAVPGRVAFAPESLEPGARGRIAGLVFLAAAAQHEPQARDAGPEARFVPLGELPALNPQPPVAGRMRGVHSRGLARTAAYPGSLWRPGCGESADRAEPETAGEDRAASPWA